MERDQTPMREVRCAGGHLQGFANRRHFRRKCKNCTSANGGRPVYHLWDTTTYPWTEIIDRGAAHRTDAKLTG